MIADALAEAVAELKRFQRCNRHYPALYGDLARALAAVRGAMIHLRAYLDLSPDDPLRGACRDALDDLAQAIEAASVAWPDKRCWCPLCRTRHARRLHQ